MAIDTDAKLRKNTLGIWKNYKLYALITNIEVDFATRQRNIIIILSGKNTGINWLQRDAPVLYYSPYICRNVLNVHAPSYLAATVR